MIQKRRFNHGKVVVTFTLEGRPNARQAHLVGSFNNWNTTAAPMTRQGDRWSARLELDDGRSYEYLYLVDGREYLPDPQADGSVRNNHGSVNSLVNLLAVKNPYARTPYDRLSEPDIPTIGVLTPNASQADVQRQRARVLVHRRGQGAAAVKDVTDAAHRLGYPDRVQVDAFLVSTLSDTGDLDELAKTNTAPPQAKMDKVDCSGLTFWIQEPVEQVELQNIVLSPLTNFDDPRSDLLAVNFDK